MVTQYKHALCLHPYFRDSRSGSLGLAVFPPTGLEYIASALRPHVGELTLVDLRLQSPLRNRKKLSQYIEEEVDLLCISINWEYSYEEVLQLVKSLPQDVTTVVGGKQATDNVEEIFEACPGVDILVRGEGEETIVEIAQGKPLEEILGISYRNGSSIIHNSHRDMKEVDAFPFPDRSLRLKKYYFNISGVSLKGTEFDILLTSRGCPYNCKFCTFNMNPWTQKRRFSARSEDSVLEELKQITADIVLIADENFFVNPHRAKRICDRIVEEGIQKRFLVQARIEIFQHPEVLESAARAGVKLFLLGIESPTDRILEQLNKGFDTAKVKQAFKIFHQFPFYYHGYFIYGNLTETEEEMMQIPDFARELGLDSITYQKLRIEKYSPLRELVENTPGFFIGDDTIVYSEELKRAGLKRISRQLTRNFYTPTQLYKIISKLFKIQLFTPRELFPVFVGVPLVLANTIGRQLNKRLQRSNLLRRLVPGLFLSGQ